MNNPELNVEGQDGQNPQVNVKEHSTGNNNHVTNSGLLEACQILQQFVDEMKQMGENPPVDTNVQEVANEGNVRCAQQVEQPQEMLNTAQMLGDGGLTLNRFVKLIKNPFFGKPDPTLADEWLVRAEKILDTARIPNSQRLVYTSFKLEASAERWWKLLSMKWEMEGVPSTWENFKREFTNKYVPAVTQERREVNFIKFEQRNMSNNETILVGSRDNNVYSIQLNDLANQDVKCLSAISETSWLWHRRLGHMHMEHSKDISSKELVRGLLKIKFEKDKLDKDEKGKDVDIKRYRGMIGSLIYLTSSRPDIMFSVCLFARFQACPKESHLVAVKRILRYLKGTHDLGLWFPRNTSFFDLIGYSDADYAGCKTERKSTSRGCQFLGHSLVSWSSKKQNSVALSTTEAEYLAVGACCAQILWMKQTLLDFGLKYDHIPILCDNLSAIDLSKNPIQHSRTKHIETKHHFIRDHVQKSDIVLNFVDTNHQITDIFTKPLDSKRFTALRRELGMSSPM
ncbi:hypothetical protein RJ640_010122 [Escallonia rubra]|uniref:Uncharacterized protein n=1 Tax=Escallonia rubra TaxID=112253 RepID=A0AA88RVS6_9ASTE|nr:hypothetical protein RJ640_010122 [Escallonia rubra]